MLLAENNIPLAFADKLNTLLPNIFPDSKIAKEYKFLAKGYKEYDSPLLAKNLLIPYPPGKIPPVDSSPPKAQSALTSFSP